MTVSDLLAWVVGIGTLLYFGAAMINPAWFISDATNETAPTATDEEVRWPNPLDLDDWQHLGQIH